MYIKLQKMKNKYLGLTLLTILIIGCSDQKTDSEYEAIKYEEVNEDVIDGEAYEPTAEELEESNNFEILASAIGDLDKDGVDEKVEVVNTDIIGEYGIERVLHIYKKDQNEGWKLWRSSHKVILPSESGGMMGDPFEDIGIENGVLVIYHWGGSSWKWSYTDRFRFQNNNFELIGATTTYGKLCEEWEDFDYNLSTGNIIVTNTKEYCDENEEAQTKSEIKSTYSYKMENLPTIENTVPGEQNIFVINKDGEEIQFSF